MGNNQTNPVNNAYERPNEKNPNKRASKEDGFRNSMFADGIDGLYETEPENGGFVHDYFVEVTQSSMSKVHKNFSEEAEKIKEKHNKELEDVAPAMSWDAKHPF